MRRLAVFTVAVLLAVCAANGAKPDDLLRILEGDMDWPRIRIQPADTEALLEYYRGRKGVNFYFTRNQIAEITAAIQRDIPGDVAAAVAAADEILAHRFPNSTSPTVVRRVQLPDQIDWDANPTDDPEFPYMLARSRFWQELGLAYLYTGDEKYAAEFARQMDAWLEQLPLPPVVDDKPVTPWWVTLNAGIRMETWMWAYQAFLGSPHMTPDLHARILGVLGEHGRLLRAHHREPSSNWCAMEMRGLLNLAVMFPELKDSTEWRAYAVDKLVEAINTQVRPDGVQVEQSPSYHNGCIGWFYEPMLIAQRNGIAFPEAYRGVLRKMAEFTLWTIGPDGRTVALSDSDRDTHGPNALVAMALEFDEPTFAGLAKLSARHYWLHGADVAGRFNAIKPAPPTELTRVFPDAGYAFVRSDWTPQANYCVFDCGPRGGGHGHFDLLSLEIYGYGQLLIADPGRWLYANVPLRREIVSTPAHNTISINGVNHADIKDNASGECELIPFAIEHAYTVAEGRHQAYRLPSGIAHLKRRVYAADSATWVILDSVDAPEEVTAQVAWQFATASVETIRPECVVAGKPADARALVVVPQIPGQEMAIETATLSRVYGEQEPAARLRITQRGKQLCFATCIRAIPPGVPRPEPPSVQWVSDETGCGIDVGGSVEHFRIGVSRISGERKDK